MKKSALIIGLIILTSSVINAQNKVKFGLKGGTNFSNMASEYFSETSSKIGIHIGFLMEVPLANKISIQPEISYSRKGTNAMLIMDGGSPASREYKLDYIVVPILTNVFIGKNFAIEIGPSFNFLINSLMVKEDLPDFVIDGELVPQEKYFYDIGESFEFSGIIGLTYRLNSGIYGSLRYEYGFNEVVGDYAKNSGFQLGIGFIF
jgi:hypothetical protein